MAAVLGCGTSAAAESHPRAGAAVPEAERRFVAVTLDSVELLRPGSDLARLVEGAGYVDVLLACAEQAPESVAAVATLHPVRGALPGPAGPAGDLGDLACGGDDGEDGDDDEEDPDEQRARDIAAAAERLGLADLHLHRLGLRRPLAGAAEPDLVAALSELVGFDPEPGVYVLAPAADAADPDRGVLARAAQRIAQVYGLPLLRYRCLELSVVDGA